jgi:hypothetical protein
VNRNTHESGNWLLETGYWKLVKETGYWKLVTGNWKLVAASNKSVKYTPPGG